MIMHLLIHLLATFAEKHSVDPVLQFPMETFLKLKNNHKKGNRPPLEQLAEKIFGGNCPGIIYTGMFMLVGFPVKTAIFVFIGKEILIADVT